MKNDLYDKLNDYQKSDFYPFHMPGHKRNEKMYQEKYGFGLDITEIDGFDELYHAEGILQEAMDNAAKYWGTDQTYFLVNGSTTGILTAMHACLDRGDKVIIGRNCHKSVYHASELLNLKNRYLYPEYIPAFGMNGGYNVWQLEQLFVNEKDVKAVVITSPTYDGVVSDIQKIAEVVHRYGAILIVDEAHGAHFGVGTDFPEPAYFKGADIVIESMHKTLPAFTQTALLHISKEGKKRVSQNKIEHFFSIFQTSSPSYLFMANMDRCTRLLQSEGKELYKNLHFKIEEFRNKCKGLHNIKILGKELIGTYGIYDLDMSKLVIASKDGGRALNAKLRGEYHLEMEMEAAKYVLAITTIGDEEKGFERLFDALHEIDQSIKEERESLKEEKFELIKTESKISISEAIHGSTKKVKITEAMEKIAAEYLYLYPPGIPLIVPGEIVQSDLANQIMTYKKLGFHVKGEEKFCVVGE